MGTSFTDALADWTPFYGLAGGAAATLLGLLFVSVSLRLNIFQRDDVEDVRDFAFFTVATFLVAIAVAGLALAPHEEQGSLALALFIIGVLGLLGAAWIAVVWRRLKLPADNTRTGQTSFQWQALAYLVGMSGPYIGLIIAAFLLLRAHPYALAWLALAEGWMLGMGTIAAWLLLSHADSDAP